MFTANGKIDVRDKAQWKSYDIRDVANGMVLLPDHNGSSFLSTSHLK